MRFDTFDLRYNNNEVIFFICVSSLILKGEIASTWGKTSIMLATECRRTHTHTFSICNIYTFLIKWELLFSSRS